MKLPFDSLSSMLGRMTARERRLFGVLAGAILVLLAAIVYLASGAIFGTIADEIERDRQSLAEIRRLAPHYTDLAEAKKAIEDAIRGNKGSVRVAANEVLKRMTMSDDVPGATGNTLADIVSFEGKTTDTAVDTSKGKKKPPKGKTSGGIMEIEQNLEFREVPADTVISFLDAVEQAKDLLFVTKIELGRKFNNLNHVRAVVTIATFQYQGEESGGAAPAAEE